MPFNCPTMCGLLCTKRITPNTLLAVNDHMVDDQEIYNNSPKSHSKKNHLPFLVPSPPSTRKRQQPNTPKTTTMAVTEDESLEEVTAHKSNITGNSEMDLSVADQLRRLDMDDGKFQSMDSVHSHQSDLSALACHTTTTSQGMNNRSFNNSFDFNDSCASFASFGGASDDGTGSNSKSSLHDSGDFAVTINTTPELKQQQQQQQQPAQQLEPIGAKRTLLMNRLPDSRLVRHASLRYTSLQLIEENDAD